MRSWSGSPGKALQESFNIADAKFQTTLQSVADRLKRKKEMLATDRDVMQLSRDCTTPKERLPDGQVNLVEEASRKMVAPT